MKETYRNDLENINNAHLWDLANNYDKHLNSLVEISYNMINDIEDKIEEMNKRIEKLEKPE